MLSLDKDMFLGVISSMYELTIFEIILYRFVLKLNEFNAS